MQRRRPPPAADTGRSCWGSGQQDTSAAQGTKWTLGTATRLSEAASFFVWSPSSLGLKGASSPFLVGPARRNRRALAALNTRHLLRKPVCGLKAPLGLSCPPGTAVLSGSLLVPKENISGGEEFYKSNITFHTRIRSAREAIISLLPAQCSAVPHPTATHRGCARPARGSSGGCGPVSRGLPASGR